MGENNKDQGVEQGSDKRKDERGETGVEYIGCGSNGSSRFPLSDIEVGLTFINLYWQAAASAIPQILSAATQVPQSLYGLEQQ